MAEIVNLRRARRSQARKASEAKAAEARIRHGTPKTARKVAKAEAQRDARIIEAHKLDDK